MLRYLYRRDLARHPKLAASMFRDRAEQFFGRLGWAVTVEGGEERDRYDALDPLYVIWQRPDGRHGGSMRFLPTTGPTMLNDHFAHLNGGRRIADPAIWECTRFCLAPDAGPEVSAALLLAASELGLGRGLRHAVAVFDARMARLYRRLGWSPTILGGEGSGPEAIRLGLWEFAPETHARLAEAAGIPPALSRQWYTQSHRDCPVALAV